MRSINDFRFYSPDTAIRILTGAVQIYVTATNVIK